MLERIAEITRQIFKAKYPQAKVIFLAGSIVRGEGTPSSDLDLVVVYEKLPAAYRETYYFQEFPVEAFVHDPETLNYFMFENDRENGMAVMTNMVIEGIEIPAASDFSRSLKDLAQACMDAGPPPLEFEEMQRQRYTITNLVDDIRQPRSREELFAAGAELYQVLANYYFRSNNLWSAKGKSILRILNKTSPELHLRYCAAFDALFKNGDAEKVIALSEELLVPGGGFLFELEKTDAPVSFRKPIS